MHFNPPSIAAVADDLPGRAVVLADGDEIGVVADVVETPATTSSPTSRALVVQMDHPEADSLPEPLVVADDAVLAVTDDAVVLGTTAPWLGQHAISD